MTAPSSITRIVAIGDPGATQQQVVSALSNQNEFDLVDLLVSPDRLVRDIRATEPDILLVDHMLDGQPTIDILDDLAMQFPTIAIIAILPSEDPVKAQQVMLAGARGFIVQPFTQINLISTIRRMRDLEARRGGPSITSSTGTQESGQPVRSLAVFSPRGGSGCSTIASNLAVSIHEETGQRVLLFEGKLAFGHLAVMMNIRSQNTLADLIPYANSLDESLIKDVIVEHATGVHVLLAPDNFQVAQGIRPDDLYSLILGIQRFFDYIVIDCGNSLSENTVTLLDAVDRILLVANPDLASLHDISRFYQISRSLSYPQDKLMVVLNRSNIIGGVRPNDIEVALHQQIYAQIPDDEAQALRSLNRGIPMIFKYPKSPASKGILKLAKTLVNLLPSEGISIPEKPSASERARRDALLASSHLG